MLTYNKNKVSIMGKGSMKEELQKKILFTSIVQIMTIIWKWNEFQCLLLKKKIFSQLQDADDWVCLLIFTITYK